MPIEKSTNVELSIDRLGHRGDGIVNSDKGALYVPFTLPGERVRADVSGARGVVTDILHASTDRVEPVCEHFQTCGGCQLQHMAAGPYREFKKNVVATALQSHGLDVSVEMPTAITRASRRRAMFSARRTKNGRLAFGFTGRRTHTIVAIGSCPILLPALGARLDDLRALAEISCGAKNTLKLYATLTESGLDVLLVDGKQDEKTRMRLCEVALRRNFCSVGFPGDIVIETLAPRLTISGVTVNPKPGTFLQAAAESEVILAQLAVDALQKSGAKDVADLFCGLGAFAFRIATFAKVTCADFDTDALHCLDRALRHSTGLKPIKTIRRDLFRNPMTSKELNHFDAVLFDPPRAGAERQAGELAHSNVKTIVAISCNPLSLARDLATLAAGGYSIKSVHPVDQFVFSPHIECVALCERET